MPVVLFLKQFINIYADNVCAECMPPFSCTESGHPDTRLGKEFVDHELRVVRQPGSENM